MATLSSAFRANAGRTLQTALPRTSNSRHVYGRINAFAAPQRRSLFYLPVILQPAFWRSLIPSFLLRRDPDAIPIRRRPWNPATYFIWMFMFIGSQAIQLVTLRTGFEKFSRETEQRIELLRDVLRRINKGQKVDLEQELGTGDPIHERAWEDVMKELASEDAIFQLRKKERERRDQAEKDEKKKPS